MPSIAPAETVIIDGRPVQVRHGTDGSLDVHHEHWWHLAPWTTAHHHQVLGACLVLNEAAQLELDADALVHAVLSHNQIPDNLHQALQSVVLWWLSQSSPTTAEQSTAEQDATKQTASNQEHTQFYYHDQTWPLRPWTLAERLAALTSARTQDQQGLDIVAYGRAMMLAALNPEHQVMLDHLDASSSGRLLSAVLEVNQMPPAWVALQTMPTLRQQLMATARQWGVPVWQLLERPAAEYDALASTENIITNQAHATASPMAERNTGPVTTPRQQHHGHSAWIADPAATVITFGGDA